VLGHGQEKEGRKEEWMEERKKKEPVRRVHKFAAFVAS
jgi:hypothetical protein